MMTQLPSRFLGRWSGTVYDSGRVRPYAGEILLHAEGGSTKYDMARSCPTGKLSQPVVTDDTVLLLEVTDNSWKRGFLKLRVNDADELVCVWKENSARPIHAKMKRHE